MAGRRPGHPRLPLHICLLACSKDVDARHKGGHGRQNAGQIMPTVAAPLLKR
jgi:hypothetical protein